MHSRSCCRCLAAAGLLLPLCGFCCQTAAQVQAAPRLHLQCTHLPCRSTLQELGAAPGTAVSGFFSYMIGAHVFL